MATEVISTIGTAPSDYTTMEAWWAAKKGDLVTADQIQIAELKPEEHFLVNFTMDAASATTDVTHYYIIRPQSGHYFDGQVGQISNCPRFTSTWALTVNVPYTQIEGIVMLLANTYSIILYIGANYCKIDRVGIINYRWSGSIEISAAGILLQGTDNLVTNCVVSGAILTTSAGSTKSATFTGIYSQSANNKIYNCVVANNIVNHTGTSNAYCNGIAINHADIDLVNCTSFGNTATAVSGTATYYDYLLTAGEVITCASGDTTAVGTNCITEFTPTDEFVHTSTLKFDGKLKSTSQFINIGTDLSATFTTDITGVTRSVWDIGAVEYTGLATYYRLDDATDSKSELDGTATNVSYTTGKINNCASFSGNGIIRVSDAPLLNFYNQFTVTLWCKASSVSTINTLIGQYNPGTYDNRQHAWVIWILPEDNVPGCPQGCVGFWGSSDGSYVSPNRIAKYGATTIDDNAWHHVAFTFNSGTILCWIDGTSDTLTNVYDTPTTIHNSTADLTIGAVIDDTTPTNYLTGLVDDIRIYNKALTQTQIQAIYADTNETYYPWQEIEAMPLYDVSKICGVSVDTLKSINEEIIR